MYKPDWSLRQTVMNDPGLKPVDRIKWLFAVADAVPRPNRWEPVKSSAHEVIEKLRKLSEDFQFVEIGYTNRMEVKRVYQNTKWIPRKDRFTPEDRNSRRYSKNPAMVAKVNAVFSRLRSIPTMKDTSTRDMPIYGTSSRRFSTFTIDFTAMSITIYPAANAPKPSGYWRFQLPPDNATFDCDCMVKADYYGIAFKNNPNIVQLYGWDGEKTAIAAKAAGEWGRGKTVEEAQTKALARAL
jgi:hypothetical protein